MPGTSRSARTASAFVLLTGSAALAAAALTGEVVDVEALAPGLTLYEWRQEGRQPAARWSVVAGVEKVQREADALLGSVERVGFVAQPVSTRDGYEIRVAGFVDRAAAESAAARLVAAGIASAEVHETGHDVASPDGPFAARILEVDPELVEVEIAHARDVAIGLETTRDLARRRGAMAAVTAASSASAGRSLGRAKEF